MGYISGIIIGVVVGVFLTLQSQLVMADEAADLYKQITSGVEYKVNKPSTAEEIYKYITTPRS